jgi:hypothetical protein
MVGKISNNAVYDSTEERRPVAKNMRHVRPKPIPIDRASLAMELLNNQTRPVVNIVGTRHFHEDPTPLDKNYPLEIELQRLAMASVPNKPQPPLKIKSAVTDDMIEKYREEERRGILKRGYDVPEAINFLDLEEDTYKDDIPEIEVVLQRGEDYKKELVQEYKKLESEMDILQKQSSGFSLDRPMTVETLGKYTIPKEKRLGEISREMKNLQSELSTTNDRLAILIETSKNFKSESDRIKRANAQKIKNAEDQIRLLNTTLPISQMPGEPDEVYRERLIALRVPVDNSRVDATEARVYEHKLFKRNLKKLIDLPLYQVENIIKTLDMNDSERTYQLNEIFPKVEMEFIKQFGRKPLLRDPVQSLTDFFINLLDAPLQAQEQSEALSTIAEAEGVFSGEIDPSLRNLKKAEVKKLITDAGLIPKGEARKFERMTVKQLKVFYTQYLTRKPSTVQEAEREMMGVEDVISREESKGFNKRKKAQYDRAIMRLLEEERRILKEEQEYDKQEKQREKQQEKSERGKMGAEEKPSRIGMKKRKEEEEYFRLIEAQRKQAEAQPSKQSEITKFMSAKKK